MMQSFAKMKPSQNVGFSDVGKSCTSCQFFHITNMSFNAIYEDKALKKVSKFTVIHSHIEQVLWLHLPSYK